MSNSNLNRPMKKINLLRSRSIRKLTTQLKKTNNQLDNLVKCLLVYDKLGYLKGFIPTEQIQGFESKNMHDILKDRYVDVDVDFITNLP